MNNRPLEVQSLDKSLKFLVHIDNKCNFNCHYCCAEDKSGNDFVEVENIKNLVSLIKKLKKSEKYKDIEIDIDLTGGEPTLHKNFIEILTFFSDLGSLINLQVTTNGSYLHKHVNALKEIKNKKIFFNISCHYFEYQNKLDLLIKSINTLREAGFLFDVKFLMPDKNVSVEEFLEFKNKIISQTGLTENIFTYCLLIIHEIGKQSTSYSQDILDYYYKMTDNDSKLNRENNLVTFKYEDGTKEDIGFGKLLGEKINSFTGYKCYYVSNKFMSFQLLLNLDIIIGGYCNTLSKLKYKINDLENLLLNGDKYVICKEASCFVDVCLILYKVKQDNSGIKKLENILLKQIKEIINSHFVEIISLSIYEKDYVELIFNIKGKEMKIMIKKESLGGYFLEFNGLYFNLLADNFKSIGEVDNSILKNIFGVLLKLSSHLNKVL